MGSMTRPEVIEFIGSGAHTGKVATASITGDPHVAPVWFVVVGGDVVFTTSRDSVKGSASAGEPAGGAGRGRRGISA